MRPTSSVVLRVRSYATLAFAAPRTVHVATSTTSSTTTDASASGLELVEGVARAADRVYPRTQRSASLRVLADGCGAVALALLPQGTAVAARADAPLAFSDTLNHDLALVARSIVVRRFECPDAPQTPLATDVSPDNTDNIASASTPAAQLVLAPRHLADIAVLECSGTAEYVLQRPAYLAHTGDVVVENVLRDPTAGVGSLSNLGVRGRGSVLISSYAGISRLILAPGETYVVDSRQIVCWDAAAVFESLDDDTQNSTLSYSTTTTSTATAATTTAGSQASINTQQPQSIWSRLSSWIARPFKSLARGMVRVALGDRKYVRVVGPADIWLETRQRPKLEYSLSIPKVKFHKTPLEAIQRQVNDALSAIPRASANLANNTRASITSQFTGFTDASFKAAKNMMSGKIGGDTTGSSSVATPRKKTTLTSFTAANIAGEQTPVKPLTKSSSIDARTAGGAGEAAAASSEGDDTNNSGTKQKT